MNRYVIEPVTPERTVWAYAGVRLFYDARKDVSAITRDYVFDIDAPKGSAPLFSIFGGKITTYRRLAEHALERLRPFPASRRVHGPRAPLPGGDIAGADLDGFLAELRRERPWLPPGLAARYACAYGTRVNRLPATPAALATSAGTSAPGCTSRRSTSCGARSGR